MLYVLTYEPTAIGQSTCMITKQRTIIFHLLFFFLLFFQKDWVRDRARKSNFTFEYRETGQLWVPLTQVQICPVFCLLVSLMIFLFIQQNGYHLESHTCININVKSLSSSMWPTLFHVLRVFWFYLSCSLNKRVQATQILLFVLLSRFFFIKILLTISPWENIKTGNSNRKFCPKAKFSSWYSIDPPPTITDKQD